MKRKGLIAKIGFIGIVVVLGVVLTQTGMLRNPFSVISEISSVIAGEDARPQRSGDRPEMADGAVRGERGGDAEASLNWSQFGGVLFNLWFMAAVAAVMMIIGRPIGWMVKNLRHPQRLAFTHT